MHGRGREKREGGTYLLSITDERGDGPSLLKRKKEKTSLTLLPEKKKADRILPAMEDT